MPIVLRNLKFDTYQDNLQDNHTLITSSGLSSNNKPSGLLVTGLSTVTTLALIYTLSRSRSGPGSTGSDFSGRSTPLPGYGILGDKVNQFIELFLDALAVYVHDDRKWECQRRMLCEANQRAETYGVLYSVLMYTLSLGVSLVLQNQQVSQSLEAMKIGRRGGDCAQLYPKCPFSL